MLMLNRSIHTWRHCNPEAMANQSNAALVYAFEDAQHDILALVDHIRKLERLMAKKRTSVPENVNDRAAP